MTNATAAITTGTWNLDPTHTEIGFSVRHLMSKVRGKFEKFEGALVTADDLSASTVNVSVDLSSINTGTADRDAHLRSGDFFENETYPDVTFVSTNVERDGDDWAVTGNLTIKGVSKPVTIVFEPTGSAKDPFGNTRAGFEGTATINRKDWGITWNAALETGGVLVSDKVKLEFDVSAIKNA